MPDRVIVKTGQQIAAQLVNFVMHHRDSSLLTGFPSVAVGDDRHGVRQADESQKCHLPARMTT